MENPPLMARTGKLRCEWLVAQDVLAECSEAAAALRLRMPLSVSTRVGETASVYMHLVHAARDPKHCIPLTPSLEVPPHPRQSRPAATD